MKLETHLQRLKETLTVINDCIEKGLLERQQTLGFATSAAASDMLELLFQKKGLIDQGFIIKHEWLKSRKQILERFPFDFPKKEEIINLLVKIEEKRNVLCYGSPQKIGVLQEVADSFNKLKALCKEVGLDEL